MKQINIAIAGLGIVGGGVYQIITNEIELLNQRSKQKINLVAVASRSQKTFVNHDKIKFYQNPLDLAEDKNIDLIVELIGGAQGVALELCQKALKNKKHYVTANKAMIANHGFMLSKLAEENEVVFAFEASVAGAIPIIKTLKEGLVANQINKIYAILNGTCNYILTKMEEDQASFVEALKQAQNLGYAEADPTFDIEGLDTAHKIAILAAIAKNSIVQLENMKIEGIGKISLFDIKAAGEFGYKIKLLGIFEDLGNNNIKQSVYPCLISCRQNLAQISDSFNGVLISGNNCGSNLQVGRGAGSLTTASAIVADIIDIANNRYSMAFGVLSKNLKKVNITNLGTKKCSYYLRFSLDKKFAQENNFIEQIFNNNSNQEEAIKQAVVEELEETRVVYGLISSQLTEEEFLSYVIKINLSQKAEDINWIRVEEIEI